MRSEWLIRTANRAAKDTAEQRELVTVLVSRPTNGEGWVDEFGDWQPPIHTTVHNGPGFIRSQPKTYVDSRRDTPLVVQEPTLELGGNDPIVHIGDVVEVTEAFDVSLLGRSWVVTGEPGDGYGVQRKYPIRELTENLAPSPDSDDGSGS